MGRQGDKSRRKSQRENLVVENAKLVADENKHVFSFANCSMMLLTVIVALIVTSAILKTAELQKLNTDQDQTIKLMKAEAESVKKSLSESFEKVESNEFIIKSLHSEKEYLYKNINDLNSKIDKKDRIVAQYQETELNLQQNFDLAISNIKSERDAEAQELHLVLSNKEEVILSKSKRIGSLQGQIITVSDENSQLSKEIKSLKMESVQLSKELVSKFDTIESLQEQNVKLSNDLITFRDETSQVIEILEEEKNICIKDSETSIISYIEEIQEHEVKNRIIEAENRIFEKTIEERMISVESEYKNKLDILEDSRSQLMKEFKSIKQEKISILDEKTYLARTLEHFQMEMDQATNNIKISKTNLEKCEDEKLKESEQNQELKSHIADLNIEKLKMESESRENAEQLSSKEFVKEELKEKSEK